MDELWGLGILHGLEFEGLLIIPALAFRGLYQRDAYVYHAWLKGSWPFLEHLHGIVHLCVQYQEKSLHHPEYALALINAHTYPHHVLFWGPLEARSQLVKTN